MELTVQRGASKAWDASSFSPTIRTLPHPRHSHPGLSAPGGLTQPASPVPHWLSPPTAPCTLTLLHIIFLDTFQLLCNISPTCIQPHQPVNALRAGLRSSASFKFPLNEMLPNSGLIHPKHSKPSAEMLRFAAENRHVHTAAKRGVRTNLQAASPTASGPGIHGIKQQLRSVGKDNDWR